MTKRCKRCSVCKNASEFNKEPRVKDGLTTNCRKCNNELSKQWRQLNSLTVYEQNRTWRANNRERSNAFGRKWAHANRDKTREINTRWAQANRARIQLYAQERRAREAGAAGSTTPEQLQARIDYYGGCCWVCRVPYQAIDHVVSLKNGGTNWPSNLRPICKACNSAKGSKHPAVFLRQRAQAST